MTSTPLRPLAELPKAHLHVHLEGAMRPDTLFELCARQGEPAPAIGIRYTDFADFQKLYVTAHGSIRQRDDLVRLVGEVVEDAAADGAVWIEPAIHLPGPPAPRTEIDVLEMILDAGRQATAAPASASGWLISSRPDAAGRVGRRTGDPRRPLRRRGVVSFGLANDEAACAPDAFAAAFAIARQAGIISAPHAGEHGGPESVRGRARRTRSGPGPTRRPGGRGHRSRDRLADDQVCLDVCPTSNVSLSVVPGLAAHPLPVLLDAGVACSINADDPLLFGVGLLDEYTVCREQLGLDDVALAACARASIRAQRCPRRR